MITAEVGVRSKLHSPGFSSQYLKMEVSPNRRPDIAPDITFCRSQMVDEHRHLTVASTLTVTLQISDPFMN